MRHAVQATLNEFTNEDGDLTDEWFTDVLENDDEANALYEKYKITRKWSK